MKVYIKKALFIFIFLIFIFTIYSFSDDSDNQYIDVYLKFENEEIYFVGSPVLIRIEIMNKSPNNYFFEVAENLLFTVDFKIYTSY
ncbi:MAG: hypothetical protein ACK4YF_02970, partial [Exilispira sp.]